MQRWYAIRRAAASVVADYERLSGTAAFTSSRGIHAVLEDLADRCFELGVTPDPDLSASIMGQLDLDNGFITHRPNLSSQRRAYTVAHELGHRALAHPPRQMQDTDFSISEQASPHDLIAPDGVYRAYNERDRWELEANIFAAELLAPIDMIREKVKTDQHWTVRGLADYFGISETAMLSQLVAALLPGPSPVRLTSNDEVRLLDDCQASAATAPPPALVLAGPGAGKTRILVERFVYLVKQGVAPSQILVLTFSNKAADEVQTRLSEAMPDHAHTIRVSTYHAFGRDLLQGYYKHLGFLYAPQLLTPAEIAAYLRTKLSALPLGQFEDLHRPTRHLHDLINTIGRAKDELLSPEEFAHKIEVWRLELESSTNRDEADGTRLATEEAELLRLTDVGRFYAAYQHLLRSDGYVDYSDLISDSLSLLSLDGVGSEIRNVYSHILVDEFQDINYASGRLVQSLDGGRGIVWAVGDPRQSIYGFRGASSANLRQFSDDYAGAKTYTLPVNYRSVEDVVRAGQCLDNSLFQEGQTTLLAELKANRGRLSEEPTVEVVVSPGEAEELDAIAKLVHRHATSKPLSDIAVLCRTRARAKKVAAALEREGLPTTWSGALEECETFKMLMGIILMGADNPLGLVRLACSQEYAIAEEDLRRLLQEATRRGRSVQAGLYAGASGEINGLSEEAQAQAQSLKRLAGWLSHQPSVWHMMTRYLFSKAQWLRNLLVDGTPAAQQSLARLGQITRLTLEFARRHSKTTESQLAAFVQWISTRLETGGLEESDEACLSVEAVHVLTIHKSKGLQWPVVIIPQVVEDTFPLKEYYKPLLPPRFRRSSEIEEHLIGETCAFYVGITRAEDALVLFRSERYAGRRATPSRYLAALESGLTAGGYIRKVLLPPNPPSIEKAIARGNATKPFSGDIPFRALRTYEECGQRFKYEYVYGLSSKADGYRHFQHVVYTMLRWAVEEAKKEDFQGWNWVKSEFFARWEAEGPQGHWYEPTYRRYAEVILRSFCERLQTGICLDVHQTLALRISGRIVNVIIDEIETGPPHIFRKYHFGRPASSHHDDNLLALVGAAHMQAADFAPFEIRLHYPAFDGGDIVATPTARVVRNRTEKMAALIADIEAGIFVPRPSSERCASCPFNLICPA